MQRLSDAQCDQLRKFVEKGGSLVATYETSLYDEEGKSRTDFGLSDLFGVSYSQGVEGPLQNSYLRLKSEAATSQFHPVLKGLEDAYRIINGTHRVKVIAKGEFPSPVTLVPTYPDLPMEDVYPRTEMTDTFGKLYLREIGKGRVAYYPGDIDRSILADYECGSRNTFEKYYSLGIERRTHCKCKISRGNGCYDLAAGKINDRTPC